MQGIGAELAFAAFRYRSFRLPVAVLAGALTGLGAAIFDFVYWNKAFDFASYRLPYALITIVSATIVAGLGAHVLTRALANTGVLDRFPAGRDRALV